MFSLSLRDIDLFDGRQFRILTMLNIPTREALSTALRGSFRTARVVEVLDQLARIRGKPTSLRSDNEPEFAGRLLDHCAYLNKAKIYFSRPGTPSDNAIIEAFNARLRAKCMNAFWFLSLADARDRIKGWRIHTKEERPHSPLDDLTPRALPTKLNQPGESISTWT